MPQLLLMPDPKPLDQRLGKKFFKKAPRRPGVYLMKDAQGKVVYVGKAKDLKQRLGNYRLANPDRMARRHLKMVNEVARIDFELCASETAALKHEKKLIRTLKPKFNRAGVWQGKPKFLVWRRDDGALELDVVETPTLGWQRFGPLGGGAAYLQRSLARLLWLAAHDGRSLGELPSGWMRGDWTGLMRIECGARAHEILDALEGFFFRETPEFLLWLGAQYSRRTIPFERRFIETELDSLQEFAERQPDGVEKRNQMTLL
jgi:predicted GIY-YIG superfamily endonuclease